MGKDRGMGRAGTRIGAWAGTGKRDRGRSRAGAASLTDNLWAGQASCVVQLAVQRLQGPSQAVGSFCKLPTTLTRLCISPHGQGRAGTGAGHGRGRAGTGMGHGQGMGRGRVGVGTQTGQGQGRVGPPFHGRREGPIAG